MKRTLAVLLSLLMLFGCLPVTGFSVSDGAADGNAAAFMRIVHLDCGRKYFSVEEIKGVIDMAAENLYTHVELAFGNEGLRFLLDDMSVSVNGASYESDAVTAAVQTGNRSYTTYSSGELTESEMDTILAYAAEQGISIIPLLNSPGHMNALMDAGEALTGTTMAYNGSARTIDVTNETATAFTLAVLAKYVAYFAEKGCTHFNLGADEYANDKYTTGAMGFGQLQSRGQYADYIAYVNNAAAIIKEAGMTPMAFNDGIYFNNVTSSGTFDSDIAVCFWTAGWTPNYTVASASTLAQQGHEIINTNDNWYYVLGNTTGYYNLSRAQTGTKETACTTVLTDSSGSVTPIGCMLCIWCDSPSVSYTTAEKENISGLLSNLAENNADYFKAPENSGDEVTLTDSETGIAVTADKLQTLTVSHVTPAPVMDGWLNSVAYDITLTDLSGAPYTGAAEVAIPVPDGWNTAYLRAYVQESDGSYSRIGGAYADGVYTASVPHFSVVALADIDPTASKTEQITLGIGESKTITDGDGNFESTYTGKGLDTAIATVVVDGTTIEGGTVETIVTSITSGQSYYIKSGDQYLSADGTFGTLETDAKWTVESASKNRYRLINGNNRYLLHFNNKYTTTSYRDNSALFRFTNNKFVVSNDTSLELGSAVTITETAAVDQTEITFTGMAAGTTSVTIGNTTYNITVAEHVETLSMYVGEETSFADTSEDFEMTSEDVVSVLTDGSKIRFTALAAGTTTVTTASDTYAITVNPIPAGTSNPTSIFADLACTSRPLSSNGSKTVTIARDILINKPKFIDELAPSTATDGSVMHYFWKARVIERSMTDGGQDLDEYADNECITEAPAAYDINALKYEYGYYYFRLSSTNDWKLLNWTSSGYTGHQLIFYYMVRYAPNNIAAIDTSDWGAPKENQPDRFLITMILYEVEDTNWDGARELSRESTYFSKGIKTIRIPIFNSAYTVVRSVVDYNQYQTAEYDGEITGVPAVEGGRTCTVKIYVRKQSSFKVEYNWVGEPGSVTLPPSATNLSEGSTYEVDTRYTKETTENYNGYIYTFSGWFLDTTFEAEKRAPEQLEIKGDVTLYGKWTRTLNDIITITADSAEKVYDDEALTANGFTVTYRGTPIDPVNNNQYCIADEWLTITADVTGSQKNVGTSDNTISNVLISSQNGTQYTHTTVNGTLTVYPKIVVEYYKDSIDASNKLNTDEIGYQTQLPPEHNGNPLNVNDPVTLSGSWLTKDQPDGYQDGVQQGIMPYVIQETDNIVIIQVLYQPAHTSLTICKEGANPLDENQTFLFRVVGKGVDVTVTVHGNSFVTIDGLTIGEQYTVTEITEWSWRYSAQAFTTTLDAGNYEASATGGIIVTLSAEEAKNSVTCTNTRTVPYWLDGDNFCVNVFASSTQN